jgi:hypothetical protein
MILALKSQLWHHPDYRDTITSKAIYDAVLEEGVTDLDAFWAFVRSRKSASTQSADTKGAASDRGGITACRGSTARPQPRQVSLVASQQPITM